MRLSNSLPVKVLIVTALAEELKALKSEFPDMDQREILDSDLSSYWINLTNMKGEEIEVHFLSIFEMGNVASGVKAVKAIDGIKPNVVIIFGLCGGFEGRVKIGDVIIGSELIYYELAKIKDGEEFRQKQVATSARLRDALELLAVTQGWNFEVKSGAIAVGEKIIANSARARELLDKFPTLLAIEMEAYGVWKAGQVTISRPDFTVIRGVCDLANEAKNDSYRELALLNATHVLKEFLQQSKLSRTPSKDPLRENYLAIHHISMDRRPSLMTSVSSELDENLRQFSLETVSLDQTEFCTGGVVENLREVLLVQGEFVDEIKGLLDQSPDLKLGYFPLAHIPLVFHVGYSLQRLSIDVFDMDRHEGKWKMLPVESDEPSDLEFIQASLSDESNTKEVALKIEITSIIEDRDIHEVLGDQIPIFTLKAEKPQRDLVQGASQLIQYTKRFRTTLDQMLSQHNNISFIHLFLAGPPTLSFRLGQQILPSSDPEFVVYNYSRKTSPKYRWGISLGDLSYIENTLEKSKEVENV